MPGAQAEIRLRCRVGAAEGGWRRRIRSALVRKESIAAHRATTWPSDRTGRRRFGSSDGSGRGLVELEHRHRDSGSPASDAACASRYRPGPVSRVRPAPTRSSVETSGVASTHRVRRSARRGPRPSRRPRSRRLPSGSSERATLRAPTRSGARSRSCRAALGAPSRQHPGQLPAEVVRRRGSRCSCPVPPTRRDPVRGVAGQEDRGPGGTGRRPIAANENRPDAARSAARRPGHRPRRPDPAQPGACQA